MKEGGGRARPDVVVDPAHVVGDRAVDERPDLRAPAQFNMLNGYLVTI